MHTLYLCSTIEAISFAFIMDLLVFLRNDFIMDFELMGLPSCSFSAFKVDVWLCMPVTVCLRTSVWFCIPARSCRRRISQG